MLSLIIMRITHDVMELVCNFAAYEQGLARHISSFETKDIINNGCKLVQSVFVRPYFCKVSKSYLYQWNWALVQVSKWKIEGIPHSLPLRLLI